MERLDKETIATFQLVTGVASEESQCSKEDDIPENIARLLRDGNQNIQLILRANGQDPLKTIASKPDFIVGLARYVRCNIFLLFVVSPQTVPCKCVRFDVDGNVLKKSRDNDDRPAFLWSELDAAALVVALDRIEKAFDSGYFCKRDTPAAKEESPDTIWRSECMRLVPPPSCEEEEAKEEDETNQEEVKGIRSLLVNDILYPPDEGKKFMHPNPNFMLSLSQALQKELSHWRELYLKCPPMEKLPDLPTGDEKPNLNGYGVEYHTDAMDEFDEIVSMRREQIENRTKTCTDSLHRLESYLTKGDSLSMLKIGKEIIATIASLEYAHELYRKEWCKSHDGLECASGKVCRHDDRVLKCFLDQGGEFELSPNDTSESDSIDVDEDSDSWFAIARMVFRSWIDDERAAVRKYKRISLLVEKAVGAGECEQIKSEIEAALGEFDAMKYREVECSQQMTAKMILAYHLPKPDEADEDEAMEEKWKQKSDDWKSDEIDGHLSFGWKVMSNERQVSMSFVFDHAGLIDHMRQCIKNVHRVGCRQSCIFSDLWNVQINPTLAHMEQVVQRSDLRNASLLVASITSVLHDASTVNKMMEWFDRGYGEDWSRACHTIMKQIRDVKLDVWIIRLSLRYFDASQLDGSVTLSCAGSLWFYTILWSGILYFPSDENSVRLVQGEKCLWVRYCHEASAVFRHRGWKHRVLVSAMQGNEEDIVKWKTLESEEVRRARFDGLQDQGFGCTELIPLSRMAGGYGLRRISRDLLVPNPLLSILCMQTQFLSSLENTSHDYWAKYKTFEKAANFFNSFIESHGEKSHEIETERSVSPMPSLVLLSKSAFIMCLLQASQSTAKMQSILESDNLKGCSVSLAVVIISIVLGSIGSIPREDKRSPTMQFITGIGLAREELDFHSTIPPKMGKHVFVDVCCAFYQSAKYLRENDEHCCSDFCFDLGIFSSMQLAFITGCQSLTIDVIERHREHSINNMKSMAQCFSSLFTGGYADQFNSIIIALLDALLKTRIQPNDYYNNELVEDDIVLCWPWIAVAFMQHTGSGAKSAGAALARHVTAINPSGDYVDGAVYSGVDYEWDIISTLKCIASLDTPDMNDENEFSMKPFASSSCRARVTRIERHEMAVGYIEVVFSRMTSMSSYRIENLVDIHRGFEPGVWAPNSTDVSSMLAQPNVILSILSRPKSLPTTCSVIFYLSKSIEDGEEWCNSAAVLVFGLAWLRNALAISDQCHQSLKYSYFWI